MMKVLRNLLLAAGMNCLFILLFSSNSVYAIDKTITLSFVDSSGKPLPNTLVYIKNKIFDDYKWLLNSDSLGNVNVDIPFLLYYFPFSTYRIKIANTLYDQLDTSMALRDDTLVIMLKERHEYCLSGSFIPPKELSITFFWFKNIHVGIMPVFFDDGYKPILLSQTRYAFDFEANDEEYSVPSIPKGKYRVYFDYHHYEDEVVFTVDNSNIILDINFNHSNHKIPFDDYGRVEHKEMTPTPREHILDFPELCPGVLKSE